jgi:hypothetical protein
MKNELFNPAAGRAMHFSFLGGNDDVAAKRGFAPSSGRKARQVRRW